MSGEMNKSNRVYSIYCSFVYKSILKLNKNLILSKHKISLLIIHEVFLSNCDTVKQWKRLFALLLFSSAKERNSKYRCEMSKFSKKNNFKRLASMMTPSFSEKQ